MYMILMPTYGPKKGGDSAEASVSCDWSSLAEVRQPKTYTSGSVTENSGSTWQGTKSSASADILTPTQLHLVYNLILTISGCRAYNLIIFQI